MSSIPPRRVATLLAAALSFLIAPRFTYADSPAEGNRARLSDSQEVQSTPFRLSGGSRLILISPSRWSTLADEVVDTLTTAHAEYTRAFGPIPPFSTSIRLMDEEAFYKMTGAPAWTNAMYFRGEIIIPLDPLQPIDLDNLYRSARHEYTHAVISSLSGGRAPGWIDEGIAQWAEGSRNPALVPALQGWLRSNDPVPLRFLQGGFTKLNPSMVPAAYAQSLFAAETLIRTKGFKKIARYFTELRNGTDKDAAFYTGFGTLTPDFESALGIALKVWSRESSENNHR